jgi:16S rRNA (cytidine1402-2'-O)-methyltransferase
MSYKFAHDPSVAWPSGKAEACKASIPQFESGCHLILFPIDSIMLYLVATPIGHLSDITFRAVETLKNCDYILCEDTRHSSILFAHYEIRKPLKSYHKFNEAKSLQRILDDLILGQHIALISDAGTPGISDPGALLVQSCIHHSIPVMAIPGPCAAIAALSCSGLNTDRFQFIGFLPRKLTELKALFSSLLSYPGTTICYESPERLMKTLDLLHDVAPDRRVVIARELTKKFEEICRGTPKELKIYWETHILKGEIVLLLSGQTEKVSDWADLSPEEHVNYLEISYHLPRKEAIKLAAEQRAIPKRQLYNELLHHKKIQNPGKT